MGYGPRLGLWSALGYGRARGYGGGYGLAVAAVALAGGALFCGGRALLSVRGLRRRVPYPPIGYVGPLAQLRLCCSFRAASFQIVRWQSDVDARPASTP